MQVAAAEETQVAEKATVDVDATPECAERTPNLAKYQHL